MKTIVLYTSGTGFTKDYGEWFAKQLSCEVYPLADLNAEQLQEYDLIVYGGWIEGGVIQGLQDVKDKCSEKQQLMVFAVGALPTRNNVAPYLKQKNNLGKVPFAYLEGGFRYASLSEGKKRALHLYKAVLESRNKETITEQEYFFIHNIGRSFNHTDLESALEFLSTVKEYQGKNP